MLGLDDLEGLSQHKRFCDSVEVALWCSVLLSCLQGKQRGCGCKVNAPAPLPLTQSSDLTFVLLPGCVFTTAPWRVATSPSRGARQHLHETGPMVCAASIPSEPGPPALPWGRSQRGGRHQLRAVLGKSFPGLQEFSVGCFCGGRLAGTRSHRLSFRFKIC